MRLRTLWATWIVTLTVATAAMSATAAPAAAAAEKLKTGKPTADLETIDPAPSALGRSHGRPACGPISSISNPAGQTPAATADTATAAGDAAAAEKLKNGKPTADLETIDPAPSASGRSHGRPACGPISSSANPAGETPAATADTAGNAAAPAPVLLISLDGFRWDYLALHPRETPHLRRLAAEGVTAHGLIPVFPSNTFPNHYAIVTGLYPSHSGIVNNHMFDARLNAFFHYTHSSDAHDPRWWGGEPIWITAVKQGRVSACSFWPGSEAKIEGVHATYWKPYDYSVPFAARLDELAGWLKLPPDQRPAVAVFYLEETNSIGHRYGPDSPQLAQTLRLLDDRIGAMEDRFAHDGITVNFVIVSDHGMTNCSADRVEILDDFIDLKQVQVDFDETVAGLRPRPGVDEAALLRALGKLRHAKAYRAADLPARFHVDPRSPRVPEIWVVPEEGWQILRRGVFARAKAAFLKGQHGYDPAFTTMHGIFIANGPAFRRGVTIPDVENIHIYNLLCAAAHLTPAPNDGDDRLVRGALRR